MYLLVMDIIIVQVVLSLALCIYQINCISSENDLLCNRGYEHMVKKSFKSCQIASTAMYTGSNCNSFFSGKERKIVFSPYFVECNE